MRSDVRIRASKYPQRYWTMNTGKDLKIYHNIIPNNKNYDSFTFNRNFFPPQRKKSAHNELGFFKQRNRLPSLQCFVNSSKIKKISYYNQLIKRDYIKAKDYGPYSQLSKPFSDQSLLKLQNQGSVNFLDNTNLYRYSKHNFQKKTKLNKNYFQKKAPIMKTEIKLYNKPDDKSQMTQIETTILPANPQSLQNLSFKNNPNHFILNQSPIIDCSIEINQKKNTYYSTLRSLYPTVLVDKQQFHNLSENSFTCKAIFITDFQNQINIKPHSKVQHQRIFSNQSYFNNKLCTINTDKKDPVISPKNRKYESVEAVKSHSDLPRLKNMQINSKKKYSICEKYRFSKYYLAEVEKQKNDWSTKKSLKSKYQQTLKEAGLRFFTHQNSQSGLFGLNQPKIKQQKSRPLRPDSAKFDFTKVKK